MGFDIEKLKKAAEEATLKASEENRRRPRQSHGRLVG